ncbi:MAG TPA: response regulator [bacterium]|nr:response regulator [bacterium]HOZ22885.1 response regulator [bacterium]
MRRSSMAEQGKILLVDDDPDFNIINRTILESDGYCVEEAKDPESAWEKILSWKPDLICLDVMMPTGTEGFHFAYKVRRDEATRHIPILMITAIHQHSDFRFSTEDGEYLPVDEFVEKPIKPEVLLAKVKALIAAARPALPRPADDKGIGLKK